MMSNDINKHFDESEEKWDKYFNELKEKQNVLFNEINQHCDNIIEKMKDRTEKWKRDAGKCNEDKDDQVIDTKIDIVSESNNYNMTNNNDNIIKNVVPESNILNSSGDEILVGVEICREGVVDEFERECEVRLGAVSYTHLDVYKRQLIRCVTFTWFSYTVFSKFYYILLSFWILILNYSL